MGFVVPTSTSHPTLAVLAQSERHCLYYLLCQNPQPQGLERLWGSLAILAQSERHCMHSRGVATGSRTAVGGGVVPTLAILAQSERHGMHS